MFLSRARAPGGLCLGLAGDVWGDVWTCMCSVGAGLEGEHEPFCSCSLRIQSWRGLERSAQPPQFSQWKLLPRLCPLPGSSSGGELAQLGHSCSCAAVASWCAGPVLQGTEDIWCFGLWLADLWNFNIQTQMLWRTNRATLILTAEEQLEAEAVNRTSCYL